MSKWRETSFGKTPKEWGVKRIDEIKSPERHAIAMGPFGSNIKVENYVAHGVPVIRGTNLNFYRYINGDFAYLTAEKADELKASNCKPGDIIFTHRGTIGQVGLIPNGQFTRYVVSQSGMKLTPNEKIISTHFLFYFFKSESGQYQLLKYESQVGVPSISNPLTSLKEIDIPYPPFLEQKAVASVLSSLDDKIDLLHRQNATLEAMADALFRQWFVVEAKEELKKQPLSSIAHFLNGLACQKYPPRNAIERLPVLKIRELNNGIGQDADWATNTISPEYIITSGDVIFSWSGSLMVKIWTGKNCVLNQHLFKVTSENYPKWFYYFWCKAHLDEFIAISESKATTMGHIKRGDLDKAEVLVPTENELAKMSESMQPLWEKLIANQTQIHTLEKLRDTLLPKLMSGEVRMGF
jgi:type I restriction enzyme S subunit